MVAVRAINLFTALVSRAKDAINADGLVPDLVRINQYWTLATNVELLDASYCTMTEANELLKNMHFWMTLAQFKLAS